MENLIVYKSDTGFTKKYVDSLERRLPESEVVDIKKFKVKMTKDVDFIFFGGPLRNSKILGLDKFLKHYEKFKDKNIFIFCTGIEPITDEKKDIVITSNGLNYYHVRLYLLPGGMDYSKMSKIMQKMMKIGLEAAAKKQNLTLDQISARLTTPMDLTDVSKLDKMLDVYHLLKINKNNK